MDVDGRVVRLDSFAKFLMPGLRLGWATGAPAIIEKLTFCVHGINLGANSVTQVHGWLNGRTDRETDRQNGGCAGGWTDGRTERRTARIVGARMAGRTDGRRDGQT
jgi:aspartate/methionine/tyrosine aminotransferase